MAHTFYQILRDEQVAGCIDLRPTENQKLMKALKKMEDGIAEVWNLGICECQVTYGGLDTFATDDKTAIQRELNKVKEMVTELHAKAGLGTKKAAVRTDAAARRSKRQRP